MTSYILVMIFLVLMSAYFSATETAFSSLSKTRLKTMIEKGEKKARLALRLAEDYDRLISTILIGNNIVNIGLASIGTVLFVKLYGDIGATISTAVITVVVLIFGEITPKSIAKDMPEKFAIFSSPIINAFIVVLTPVNFIFSMWKKLVSRIIKTEEGGKMSQEELLMLVDEVVEDGVIDDDESDIIKNAIEFTEQEVGEILTHRVDLVALPVTADKSEFIRLFDESRFSRLLVYEESLDNIIGVIHIKDLLDRDGITTKEIKDIMTTPMFVQRFEKINDLLTSLQQNKSHIAVVLDEYGGTLGIVTMEDILEELVGEIWDEHDEVVENFKKTEENIYIVDASVSFDEFCEFFDVTDTEIESVSVGGWITEQLGHIPEIGEGFECENLSIKVKEIDSHRITEISVVVNEKEETEE